MPGLFGVAAFASQSSAAPIERMRRTLESPKYCLNVVASGDSEVAVGMTAIERYAAERRPVRRGCLLASVDGEFIDRPMRDDVVAVDAVYPDADCLLDAYVADGPECIKQFEGKFSACIWDGKLGKLILFSDRFGMKPLYWTECAGNLLFSAELKGVIAALGRRPAWNLAGMVDFLSFGHLLGDHTFYDRVQVLSAASILSFDRSTGRIETRRYWRPRPSPRTPSESAVAMDRLDDALARSVKRNLGGCGRPGISLSGGLDGRTIVALLDRTAPPLTSVCLGMEGSLDHQCAAKIAALTGCRHHAHVLDAEFLSDFAGHFRRMVQLTDGHQLDQCIVMPTLPLYADLGIDRLLRGHAGELFHLDKAYNYSMRPADCCLAGEAALLAWCRGRLKSFIFDGLDRPLLRGLSLADMEWTADESLTRALSETDFLESAADRISWLFVSQRLRRETALSMTIFNSVVETRIPFLDRDVIEAVLEIPPAQRFGDRIQSQVIRRRRPALLTVKNSNTNARMGASSAANRIGLVAMKVMGRLGFRGFQPYERLGLWLRRELRPWVHELLLSDECLQSDLFEPDTVRRIVERNESGERNFTYLILALMILEQGRRDADRISGVNAEMTANT